MNEGTVPLRFMAKGQNKLSPQVNCPQNLVRARTKALKTKSPNGLWKCWLISNIWCIKDIKQTNKQTCSWVPQVMSLLYGVADTSLFKSKKRKSTKISTHFYCLSLNYTKTLLVGFLLLLFFFNFFCYFWLKMQAIYSALCLPDL